MTDRRRSQTGRQKEKADGASRKSSPHELPDSRLALRQDATDHTKARLNSLRTAGENHVSITSLARARGGKKARARCSSVQRALMRMATERRCPSARILAGNGPQSTVFLSPCRKR